MDNIDKLAELIEPVVNKLGFELYHIEFVKEDGENFLRIYIDKDSGISLDDCEKVSRPVSDLLDETDLIDESYCLEVSSPGIFRTLYNDAHFNKYIGREVNIDLSVPYEEMRKCKGILMSFTHSALNIKCNNDIYNIPRNTIKSVTLSGEL